MVRFRVRSIYDIPLIDIIQKETKFELVQPTKDQAEIFHLEQNQIAPDLEISDVDGGVAIKIEGKETKVLAVEDALRSICDDIIIRRHNVELHAVYMGRVKHVNRQKSLSIIELDENKDAIMFSGNFRRGDPVVVQIKELNLTQDQLPRCSEIIHLAGKFVILEKGASFVRVSRSLPKVERDALYRLGLELRPNGHGLIMRTSAVTASREEILADLRELLDLSAELDREARTLRPTTKILGGTTVSHVFIPGHCKQQLTAIRSQIVKTLPQYHFFKSYSDDLAVSVDFATALIDKLDPSYLAQELKRILLERDFHENQHIRIQAYTLHGDIEDTSFGQLTWDGDTLILHRSFRTPPTNYTTTALSEGVHAGDYSLTYTKEGAWNLHSKFYTQEGELIGEAFDIVTPVEFSQNQRLRFINLDTYITISREKVVEIHESDILDIALSQGIISETLYMKVDQIINLIIERIEAGTDAPIIITSEDLKV